MLADEVKVFENDADKSHSILGRLDTIEMLATLLGNAKPMTLANHLKLVHRMLKALEEDIDSSKAKLVALEEDCNSTKMELEALKNLKNGWL